MDIRESIRKAIREAKNSTTYNATTQPNLYELSNFLKKSGYNLVNVISHKETESTPELIIEPIKDNNHLYPEIVHDMNDGLFYVKVDEYGLLISSDVEEIVKGYTNAIAVLDHLGSIDLDKLELIEEEE